MREELKERLIRHLRFLEEELSDYPLFESLSWEEYSTNRSKRREVERWVENLVNSSIDIAKLILSLEGIEVPQTYRAIVFLLGSVEGFDKRNTEELARYVRLRNVIAHEYLDVKWNSIRRFILQSEALYGRLVDEVRKYLGELLDEETS
ncbi:DUF86 domain-containing protein [Candidatus Poribacteria bacterium]|nr:DUF86 domain-containing protein [Candidatus Poribacteria bacterium]